VAKTASSIVNRPLEQFLLALAVDEDLRTRFSEASDAEKREILSTRFRMGDKTIEAVLSGAARRVRARFRFSDQQGTPTPPARPPKKPARGAKKR
jgi:hypothetical protein